MVSAYKHSLAVIYFTFRRSDLVDMLAGKLLEKTTHIISIVNVSPRPDNRRSGLNTTRTLQWVRWMHGIHDVCTELNSWHFTCVRCA